MATHHAKTSLTKETHKLPVISGSDPTYLAPATRKKLTFLSFGLRLRDARVSNRKGGDASRRDYGDPEAVD
jgi:hypothetical protein